MCTPRHAEDGNVEQGCEWFGASQRDAAEHQLSSSDNGLYDELAALSGSASAVQSVAMAHQAILRRVVGVDAAHGCFKHALRVTCVLIKHSMQWCQWRCVLHARGYQMRVSNVLCTD